MSKVFKVAHRQGQEACSNGYERISPYQNLLAEHYWYAGFDGVDFKTIDQQYKDAAKQNRKEILSKLGYSRIGRHNV